VCLIRHYSDDESDEKPDSGVLDAGLRDMCNVLSLIRFSYM